ncbi:MAG: ABC transporter ATP-binding protein [Candidatus Obscuribacterales bacterium]
MDVAIEARELVKEFASGKVRAIDGLDLSIFRGEIFGIVGPNGAGKTTFMSLLLGLLWPTSGSLSIGGLPPESMEVHRKIGYLPERLDFIKWMSGIQFMEFNAALLGIDRAQSTSEIERLFELVELERGSWSRRVKSYSRGMLQRIGMAQALLGSPEYLFLDEPSSGLDPLGVSLFRRILLEQKELGRTVVINSHQLDQLERVCDRVAFIKSGKVQSVETMKSFSPRTGTLIVRFHMAMEAEFSVESLREIVSGVGAELELCDFPRASIRIEGDEMSSDLIGGLSKAGMKVVEASRGEGRLESFFVEVKDSSRE